MPVISLPDQDTVALVGPLPPEAEVVIWSGQTDRAGGAPDRLNEIEFFVGAFGSWTLDADTFAAMPRLTVVQVTSAGYDHVLDVLPTGVRLCNGRGVHGGPTSELILALVLASIRELPRFVRAQQERNWDYTTTDELAGKTVLIIGAGDLGQQTARRVRAFDAEPVLVGRTARSTVDGIVHGQDEIDALLPTADVVVLVVPRTPETTGLVDAQFLARMKDGALLVNAARGPVVVTGDLIAELDTGRLYAALDVTDPEPLPADHPLWAAPNLLLTPHVGGSTFGFRPRAAVLIREQVERYVRGEPLINIVN